MEVMNKLKPIFVSEKIVLDIRNDALTIQCREDIRRDNGWAQVFAHIDPIRAIEKTPGRKTTELSVFTVKEETVVKYKRDYALSQSAVDALCDVFFRLLRRCSSVNGDGPFPVYKNDGIDNFMFLEGEEDSILRVCAYSCLKTNSYYRPIIKVYKEPDDYRLGVNSRLFLPVIS